MSYAVGTDMTSRFDVNRLGQLVRDDGTVASKSQLEAPDPTLQTMLDDAASLINAACLQGGRYLPTDLTGLAGVDQKLLLRLNCELAFGLLLRRRGYPSGGIDNLAPGFQWAQQTIQLLQNGDLVFNVPAAITAGEVQAPVTLSDKVNLVSSAYRYFGDLGQNTLPGGNQDTEFDADIDD